MITHTSGSANETQNIGKALASKLKSGSIVALFGELGSGKTQFIKGICSGLGVKEIITSPTFIIINEYNSPVAGKIFHFDLYRMKNKKEVLDLGFEDYLNSEGIILIEWPELIENILPLQTNKIHLFHSGVDENTRDIRMDVSEK